MVDRQLKVGIGVIVVQDNKVLLGQRLSKHGVNTWAPPGGHLEFGESPIQCAIRELKEETNLDAIQCKELTWTNDIYPDQNRHYISLFIHVKEFSGTLVNLEPEKCLQWDWFSVEELPDPLFLSFQNFLKKDEFHNLVTVEL